MTRTIYLLPLVALIITSCSFSLQETNKDPYSSQWCKHQKELLKLDQYQTIGIFTYFSDQRKIYAHFFLQKTSQDNHHLILTNQLGNTEIKINFRHGIVQLLDNKGQTISSRDPEETIKKLTGIFIPFNNLFQWIIGLPGEATDYKLNNQYHLKEINYIQKGKIWKIIYRNYDNKIQPPLPSDIELNNGDRYIKLKMNNWIIK